MVILFMHYFISEMCPCVLEESIPVTPATRVLIHTCVLTCLDTWFLPLFPESARASFLCCIRCTSRKKPPCSERTCDEIYQKCFLLIRRRYSDQPPINEHVIKIYFFSKWVFMEYALRVLFPHRWSTQLTLLPWPNWSPPAWRRSVVSSPAPACRNRFVSLSLLGGGSPFGTFITTAACKPGQLSGSWCYLTYTHTFPTPSLHSREMG